MRKLALALVFLASACSQSSSPQLSPADIELTADEREAVAMGQRPVAWFETQLQGSREVVDGQTLNAKLQFILQLERAAATPEAFEAERAAFASAQGRAEARAATDRRWRIHTLITPDMARVEDRAIPGRGGNDIPARIYAPQTDETQPLPVLVYYHGGGFIFASVDAVDRMARLIANEAHVIVVSVDYRLAPEHPYPAAHDDAEDAFVWARANAASFGGDPARVSAGGDSAGGHLATVTAQRLIRADQPPPYTLLLYYPALTMATDDHSYELFGNGYGLDLAFIEAVIGMEFPDTAMRAGPEGSPLDVENLAAMPPTIIVTAGFDPLRDQGKRFADQLQAQGRDVTYRNYPSLTHSFLNWSGSIEDAAVAAHESAQLHRDLVRR